jgi:hypothetical protein
MLAARAGLVPGLPLMRLAFYIRPARVEEAVPAWRRDRALIEEVRFAPDSLLEGAGFEPSVPRVTGSGDTVPGAAAGAALVHGPGYIAHHNIDPLERPVELN